jgi:hypothetical protein
MSCDYEDEQPSAWERIWQFINGPGTFVTGFFFFLSLRLLSAQYPWVVWLWVGFLVGWVIYYYNSHP